MKFLPSARSRARALAALLALSLAGCDEQPPARAPLSVFAASSLTEGLQDLERGFEAQRPDLDVQLNFAGSQVLRLQLEQGADADVFASADERHMRALLQSGRVEAPQTLAQNELVVIVPASSPLRDFWQLRDAQRVVLGTAQVPVGAYAAQLLQRADAERPGFAAAVRAHVVSEESNVRLVRAKVQLGEADAAIVYATDAAGVAGLRTLTVPPPLNLRARYPIAVVAASPHAAAAAAFIAYARSASGQRQLSARGFLGAQ